MNRKFPQNDKVGSEKKYWDETVNISDTIIDLYLKKMDKNISNNKFEESLYIASFISQFISKGGGFRKLSLPKLEKRVVAIGSFLFKKDIDWKQPIEKRVLHVLTEAYELFGHTKLCRKWITSDQGETIHDVVILAQRGQVPDNLRNTVEQNGGKLYSLDRKESIIKRAERLRRIALNSSSYVVLHIHPTDLTPIVAFSTPGGPPVVLENHADHVFWIGSMITDIVFDIRESGQEWTLNRRGIKKSCILPIPIEANDDTLYVPENEKHKIRREMREKLGIPKNAVVFLSIGAARKYETIGDISFTKAIVKILEKNSNAWIVVIGPKMKEEWITVSEKYENRLVALGNRKNLGRYHCMSDVYLEGIPVGSLTALLEAGLNGLPCVRAPLPQTPPYSADGKALSTTKNHKNIEEYVDDAIFLSNNIKERGKRGEKLKSMIYNVHCKKGWFDELSNATCSIPNEHMVNIKKEVKDVPEELNNYWLSFTMGNDFKLIYNKLFINALKQLLYNVKESRILIEKHIPHIFKKQKKSEKIEKYMLLLMFPELEEVINKNFKENSTGILKLTNLTKELMIASVADKRRFKAFKMWCKAICQDKDMMFNMELWKGFFRILPLGNYLVNKYKRI